MRRSLLSIALVIIIGTIGCDGDNSPSSVGSDISFFVTSATSITGNLGGLGGADSTCRQLAAAAGQGGRDWRAYLSVEHDPLNGNQATNARDRIGAGPWYNANMTLVANNVAELHARTGDASVFIDEHGQRINGQWTGSPSPVQHDILTGSNADGTLIPGMTCADWTSSVHLHRCPGRALGRDGPGPEHCRHELVLELGACEPGLFEHGAERGIGRFYCFARQ